MSRKGENIRKRKDGRWEGRIKATVSNGKTKYKSFYGKTYREVKEKMHASILCDQIENDVYFIDVVDEWIKYKGIAHKGSTKAKYEYVIKQHIRPFFKDVRISQMSSVLINDFAAKKIGSGRLDGKGGLSASYVRGMIIIISSVMDYAVSANLCEPLFQKAIKPVPEKKEPSVLSREQQTKFEEYLFSDKSLTSLGILISLYTGLRIGEVCALTWENIDLKHNILHVKTTVARVRKSDSENGSCSIIDVPKTKSSIRDIPIPTKLQSALLEMRYISQNNKYVLSDSSTFLSPRTFEYRYHKALSRSCLEKINYHSLRHTFATRCIEVGMDVKTLSEILGHSNVAITLNTYVHPSMDLKREQLEKLCV